LLRSYFKDNIPSYLLRALPPWNDDIKEYWIWHDIMLANGKICVDNKIKNG